MKNCYIVSYDLASGGDYERLYNAIKEYGIWAHITESTWAVVTEYSAVQVRDDIEQHLSEGSRIFVVKSGVEAAWQNVICRNDWLKKHL